jgi:hypothetical protein
MRAFAVRAASRRALAGADQRIGDEDVVQPGFSHHLGLAQLLAGDADGTEFDLPLGKVGEFVGLDMRAQRQAMGAGVILHPHQIVLDDIEIDDRDRRLKRCDISHGTAPRCSRPRPECR